MNKKQKPRLVLVFSPRFQSFIMWEQVVLLLFGFPSQSGEKTNHLQRGRPNSPGNKICISAALSFTQAIKSPTSCWTLLAFCLRQLLWTKFPSVAVSCGRTQQRRGIRAAFLRDLDLHTFPVCRYRHWLLTHAHTWYDRAPRGDGFHPSSPGPLCSWRHLAANKMAWNYKILYN